jgi:pyridoxal phosphate enzyme (YggS family)
MSELAANDIKHNYQRILEKLAEAALSVKRDPGDIRLVVVTKTHPVETIKTVIAAGATDLGENRVEEAEEKIPAISDHPGIQWHMIGHVQSRKAQAVCQHFAWLHSIDRIKLANRVSRFCVEMGRVMPVLLEFNVSGEESKSGWHAFDESLWPNLVEEVGQIVSLPGIEMHGLMTMAPYSLDPEASRPVFVRLRRLRDYLAGQFPSVDFSQLSMGMSMDYEVGVQEGATMVRIGTAILGQRH